jgi:hypothetical protein
VGEIGIGIVLLLGGGMVVGEDVTSLLVFDYIAASAEPVLLFDLPRDAECSFAEPE